MLPDPWLDVERKYPVGAVVTGEVTRTAPFGAFVQLEPGVEGLVHISEVAFHHVAKPDDAVSSGDVVRVKVLRVRPDERRISLSIKQADQLVVEDNPKPVTQPEVTPEAGAATPVEPVPTEVEAETPVEVAPVEVASAEVAPAEVAPAEAEAEAPVEPVPAEAETETQEAPVAPEPKVETPVEPVPTEAETETSETPEAAPEAEPQPPVVDDEQKKEPEIGAEQEAEAEDKEPPTNE